MKLPLIWLGDKKALPEPSESISKETANSWMVYEMSSSIEGVKEKASHIDWHKKGRKEHYAIFARSFREKIRESGLLLVDLKGMKKIFE